MTKAPATLWTEMSWITRDGCEVPSGPWRRQTGVASDEAEHAVYLTNDAGDTLILNADDVAAIVNARLTPAPQSEEAALDIERRLSVLLLNIVSMAVVDETRRTHWQRIETPLRKAWMAATRIPLSGHNIALPPPTSATVLLALAEKLEAPR